jgi:hypothetical protein
VGLFASSDRLLELAPAWEKCFQANFDALYFPFLAFSDPKCTHSSLQLWHMQLNAATLSPCFNYFLGCAEYAALPVG